MGLTGQPFLVKFAQNLPSGRSPQDFSLEKVPFRVNMRGLVAGDCPLMCNCVRLANDVIHWSIPRNIMAPYTFWLNLCAVLGNRKQTTHLLTRDDWTETTVSGTRILTGHGWEIHLLLSFVLFVSTAQALLPLPGSTWSQTKISRIDPMLVLFLK